MKKINAGFNGRGLKFIMPIVNRRNHARTISLELQRMINARDFRS
jgi:hypothetical protein